MKYRVFPKGYDPAVASGPPDEDFIRAGIMWTEQDTKAAQALEKQATIQDRRPRYLWSEEVDDNSLRPVGSG